MGYHEFKKDPNFFNEDREGGIYVVDRYKPNGSTYTKADRGFADTLREKYPNPAQDYAEWDARFRADGVAQLWFIPKEYANEGYLFTDEIRAFLPIRPVWEIARGAMKPAFYGDCVQEAERSKAK